MDGYKVSIVAGFSSGYRWGPPARFRAQQARSLRKQNALVFLVERFVNMMLYVQYYTYQTATSFACWT